MNSPTNNDISRDGVERAVRQLLDSLGQADHGETDKTPSRVAEMWSESLVAGYRGSPEEVLSHTMPDTSGALIHLRSIPFHSVCPHHLVPFFGTVDLAYQPKGRIVGLGALEKLVAVLSRRLTLQEEFTGQIVDALMQYLDAQGAACRVRGQHLCLMLRGREPRDTEVITYAFRGSLDNAFHLFQNLQTDPPGRDRTISS